MSQTHYNIGADQSFLYRQLPYINFYQYPPAKPVTDIEQLTLAAKLDLDKPISWGPFFTVFVSIPYCRSRCHSCRFFKGLLPSHVDRYVFLEDYLDCLDVQIQKYAATKRFSSAICGAVYLGGGTASLLAPDQVNRVVRTIRQSFAMDENVEITLEGNPRDFSLEYFQEVKKEGVNRVSIGLQSIQDAILKKINCTHNSQAGLNAVKNALDVGFNTVNIDMLYQVPGQTLADWQYDLQTVLDFQAGAITIYSYVIQLGSASERLIASGRLPQPVDADTAHEWYLWARERLHQYGYIEQRKGLFSRPGHEQQYGKLSYTRGCEIVGIGAGSYSFINRYQFNVTDDAEIFKEQSRGGQFPAVSKLSVQATNRNMMERYVIFSFYSFSLNRQEFFSRFGQDPLAIFPEVFSRLERQGLAVIDDTQINLTELGRKWRTNVLYEFYSEAFK